jgi:hypothetical protein
MGGGKKRHYVNIARRLHVVLRSMNSKFSEQLHSQKIEDNSQIQPEQGLKQQARTLMRRGAVCETLKHLKINKKGGGIAIGIKALIIVME